MEDTSQQRSKERFYCPYPGCDRSFVDLWRLKVHYRADPDVRGSGKERGHGVELDQCPKCNKALQQGKHHVGCIGAVGPQALSEDLSRAVKEEQISSKNLSNNGPSDVSTKKFRVKKVKSQKSEQNKDIKTSINKNQRKGKQQSQNSTSTIQQGYKVVETFPQNRGYDPITYIKPPHPWHLSNNIPSNNYQQQDLNQQLNASRQHLNIQLNNEARQLQPQAHINLNKYQNLYPDIQQFSDTIIQNRNNDISQHHSRFKIQNSSQGSLKQNSIHQLSRNALQNEYSRLQQPTYPAQNPVEYNRIHNNSFPNLNDYQSGRQITINNIQHHNNNYLTNLDLHTPNRNGQPVFDQSKYNPDTNQTFDSMTQQFIPPIVTPHFPQNVNDIFHDNKQSTSNLPEELSSNNTNYNGIVSPGSIRRANGDDVINELLQHSSLEKDQKSSFELRNTSSDDYNYMLEPYFKDADFRLRSNTQEDLINYIKLNHSRTDNSDFNFEKSLAGLSPQFRDSLRRGDFSDDRTDTFGIQIQEHQVNKRNRGTNKVQKMTALN